jgi:hypothetical protein
MADSKPSQAPRTQWLRFLIAASLLATGLFSTLGPFYVLTTYNLLGFRGPPRESNPFAHQNVAVADLIVLGIMGAVAVVLSMYRVEKQLARSFIYGMWLGLGIGLAKILFR